MREVRIKLDSDFKLFGQLKWRMQQHIIESDLVHQLIGSINHRPLAAETQRTNQTRCHIWRYSI